MEQPFSNSVSGTLNTAVGLVTDKLYDGNQKVTGIKGFDCGNTIINKFVHSSLKAKGKSANSAVTVLLDESRDSKLVGFYTISAHSLERDGYSLTGLFGSLPRYVPVLKLDMLGVDIHYQKQGYGEELVALAMEKTAVLAKAIGCYGLFLDADKDALNFYKKLGFVPVGSPDETYGSTPMFLHLNAILDAID
ncbi:GNAT family N-acetyltransferase [Vibrio fluvialis]|nr:GNAT family N-acetyltransferase [Vibrio fluvialis]